MTERGERPGAPRPGRCIVNVATEEYAPFQSRLIESLRLVGFQEGLLTWTSTLPPGSPTHEEVPYGFKAHAIREALRRDCTSVLWLDAPCVALAEPGPLFEAIEREGHVFVSGDDRLGHWASDACLDGYSLERDLAMSLPLIHGSFIGLDLRNPRSRGWLEGWLEGSRRGLFNGASLSPHAPQSVRARMPGKSEGPVSRDPRCWGHRHDEAVGSCLAYRMGLRVEAGSGLPGRVFRLVPGPDSSQTA